MKKIQTDLVVIGGGPGGYTAAFYAADRGKKVILVERCDRLGGTCLNHGCIPSKALLHATGGIKEAEISARRGVFFGKPRLDLKRMRIWKNSILEKLGGGISSLAKTRGVEVLQGLARFEGKRLLRVETSGGQTYLEFKQVIIATGSRAAIPPAFDLGNPRIMTATEALELQEIPKKLLIVGGGYIGMELGMVYARLGSRVVMAEALDRLMTGSDSDLAGPVVREAERMFTEIRLKARIQKMTTHQKQVKVSIEFEGKKKDELYDRVLIAVGRIPNSEDLGLEDVGIIRDDRGFIGVNQHQQTSDPDIYAIGDVAGGPLLAHKASRQAKVAVNAILGEDAFYENVVIPAVVFTEPEMAWCGLTEIEARDKGYEVKVTKFPWGASGRALTMDKTDGLTKLVLEPETGRILGVGIVGHGAGELIGEGVLAVEMGATAADLAESVHAHPTLSETLMEAAEAFYGHSTHMARFSKNSSHRDHQKQ